MDNNEEFFAEFSARRSICWFLSVGLVMALLTFYPFGRQYDCIWLLSLPLLLTLAIGEFVRHRILRDSTSSSDPRLKLGSGEFFVRDDRIVKGVVDAVLALAMGRAEVDYLTPPAAEDVAEVFISPCNSDAPRVRLTDTSVSLYLEFLDAHWGGDSSEDVPFEERTGWAVEHMRRAAEFGLVRVRRRWQFWGRQTHLLTSHSDLNGWREDGRFVIVRVWQSWF